MEIKKNEIAGIIPAAGKATRLGQLPISKELYPIAYKDGKVRVVASHLMDDMIQGGASQIHFVIRNGKWDIPAYFESKYKDAAVCYHLIEYGYGVPFTINQALPFVMDKTVVFGFPDILFKPTDAFSQLVQKLHNTDASIVLGLFPVSPKAKFDRAVFDAHLNISKIELKTPEGSDHLAWIIAAWKPDFSKFLHELVEGILQSKTPDELTHPEIQISDLVNHALQSGLKAKAVVFEKGECIDIGLPEELEKRTSFKF